MVDDVEQIRRIDYTPAGKDRRPERKECIVFSAASVSVNFVGAVSSGPPFCVVFLLCPCAVSTAVKKEEKKKEKVDYDA